METTPFQDHYEILGVPVDADPLEVRRAYRQKVKEFHPDVSADKAGATEAFIRLKEAYNVLSDPERRTNFDLIRANHRARARETGPTHHRTTSHSGASGPTGASGSQARTGYGAPGGSAHTSGPDTWTRYHRNLTVPELLQRAMREIGAGRNAYARRDLAEILAREPENPDALVLMGRLFQAEGKVKDWIRVLEEGVRKNPGHMALRLALNEARRSMAEGEVRQVVTQEDRESRRSGYMAGGIIAASLAMLWGVLQHGGPFVLSVLVPVRGPLLTGTMICAFLAGWTMAATEFISAIDDELFFPDTLGRSLSRCHARNDPPLGLAVPVFALIHYFLAVGVMALLMAMRGTVSRSLLIVSATALGLSLAMVMAAPAATQAIMFWCPGWLLFALFTGWLIGDFFR
jgi:curved DNA-binding protein CbpA